LSTHTETENINVLEEHTMAMLYRWGVEELDTLCTPEENWRLDLLNDQSKAGRARPFESLEACWREDVRRAEALRRLPRRLYAQDDDCDPLQLAAALSEAAEAQRIVKCAASAAYMRDRRLALLGSLLKLIDSAPQTELAFVCISHIGWYLTPRYNWRILSSLSEHLLDLFSDGPLRESGFFVGIITGCYEPNANNIQLYLNGLCAGNKVQAFRSFMDPGHQANFYYEFRLWEVKNLMRQISGVMPRGIVELPEDIGGPYRRMRQPYHSAYLLWLVKQSLSALVVTNDAAINEKGELIATPYPIELQTGVPSFLDSSPGLDATDKVDWSRFELVPD
jgi:hypothetical protein